MKPYHQGDFDNLCGLYSLINSAKYLLDLSEEAVEKLFIKIIKLIDQKPHQLSNLMQKGVSITIIEAILKELLSKPLTVKRPFRKNKEVDLDTFWRTLTDYINKSDGKKRVMMINLEGKLNHWSVVNKMTPKQIMLFDSNDLKLINRNNCTVSKSIKGRHHSIDPYYSILLEQA